MSENYLKLFASTTKSLVNIRKQCRTVGQLLGITSKVQYIVQQFWKPLEIHFQMAGNSVKVFENTWKSLVAFKDAGKENVTEGKILPPPS